MLIVLGATLFFIVTNISSSSDVKKPEIAGATTAEEGDALTLTCTADSSPPPLITWTKLGFNTSLVNRNGSLIIPNVTAGDSGLYICTIKNLNTTLTEKVDVKVKYVRKPKIAGKTVIKEGDTLTLNCTADTFPPSLITWTKSGTNKTLSNKTAPDSGTSDLLVHNVTAEDSGHYLCTSNYLNTSTQDVNVTVIILGKVKIAGDLDVMEGRSLNLSCGVDGFPQTFLTWTKLSSNSILNNGTGSATLFISNVTSDHAGRYICTAEHLNNTERVDVKVKYQRSLRISGETAVVEGQVLNLTCSIDSWPLSFITWTKPGFSSKNGTGAAALVIYNVTAVNGGLHVCTAEYLNKTLREEVNIEVKMLPKILNESGCEAQRDLLTCVCISQGFPLPRIEWLLQEKQTDYSFNTEVSTHTVKSTVVLTENKPSRASAVCVSWNENGKLTRNLMTKKVNEAGQFVKFLQLVTQPGTIIPFVIGVLLSALILCSCRWCCRKKQKMSPAETLEMEMMGQENPPTNNWGPTEYGQFQDQEVEGMEGGTTDVDYSDIKFFAFENKQSAGKNGKKKENSDTDYAKIKPKETRLKVDEGDKVEEEKELNLCAEEVKGEDLAVYSNVSELMDQI
ncbi:peroxidasin homolog [Nothobranchius furzeri]|uniref:Hemicentin-1-like n=1 Tax=Nothobranchius furzeri TaxID=105023 RepID=A0A9D2YVS4_NOTFU|nr:hemicentin-1-like [Nothobranchius furzeri]